MNNSIVDFILSIGKHINGPTFIKDFEDTSTLISELQTIASSIKEESIRDEIDMDIRFIKAGEQGEKNVHYELKNSFIPMLILHNVVIQYDDYKAQMDYILITNKFICILETKKLNGNITINSDGDFIRSFTNKHGKVYKKEGMYSPISQNQRHVRILENLLIQEKIIKKTPVLSLVVIANPKSIIDFKYTKKEIRDQIVKYDQLIPRIKKMLEVTSEVNLSPAIMEKTANFLAENHVEVKNTFIEKFEKYLNTAEPNINIKQYELPFVETVSNIIDRKVVTVEENKIDYSSPYKESVYKETIRVALVKFRLERSRVENIKAYFIFNNKQLDTLMERMPTTTEELIKCDGFGAAKVEKYGEQILRILEGGIM